MDYKGQAHMLRRHYLDNMEGIIFQRLDVICKDCNLAATAITDLLARAEEAERERDSFREVLDMYGGEEGIVEMLKQAKARAESAEARESLYAGIADKYQKEIVPRLKERLEKAEKCTKAIEDTLGDDFDLKKIRELVEADRDGRVVVLPCKPSDVTVYQLRSKKHAKGRGVSPRHVGCATVWAGGHYQLEHQGDEPCRDRDFGKTWFLTPESAEAALKGEKDG